MSEHTCYLLTIYYEASGSLLRVAVKIKNDALMESVAMWPDENREYFRQYLPEHVKSCGPIVAVETIFEIVP